MTLRLVLALLASSLNLSPACVSAAPLESAATLAESTLLGVQNAVTRGLEAGKTAEKSASCVRSLNPSLLVPVFEEAIAENWSAAEIADVEGFLKTPVGKKYALASLAKVDEATGGKRRPAPGFTADEVAQLQRFQATTAGNQFMVRSEFSSAKSRRRIQERILELLQGCGIGRR